MAANCCADAIASYGKKHMLGAQRLKLLKGKLKNLLSMPGSFLQKFTTLLIIEKMNLRLI